MLSIVQWHHFAYMIISLALLGYGASGTFIARARRRLEGRLATAFSACAAAAAASMPLAFAIGQGPVLTIDELPPDFAEQHEHYVKGAPRR